MEVVASLSQSRTAAAQCGLFTYKSVPVIFEPPCSYYMKHQLEHIKTLHFPTECTYVYHMILKINSPYFTKRN